MTKIKELESTIRDLTEALLKSGILCPCITEDGSDGYVPISPFPQIQNLKKRIIVIEKELQIKEQLEEK